MSSGVAAAAMWLLPALPAVIGAALCVGGHRLDRWAVPASLTTAAAGLALAVTVALARPAVGHPFVAGASFEIGVDALAALVVPTVAAVTLLVLVFAAGEDITPRPRFHGLMLLFSSSVAITATATNLPTLLMGWEIMGAASYALIGFHWRDADRVDAGLTAFLTTRTADLGLYLAAAAALAGGAGLSLTDLPQASSGWRDVAAAGILVAAVGKAAQLPFSFWLSRAMLGPSPVSALLHSAAMVAMGGYLLLRVSPLLHATGWAGPTAAWLGAATAVLMGVVAVAQHDLKQLLAASTAAQLGFVVMAAGLGAVSGGVAQLVAHAATKAALFLAAGAWLSALGTRRLESLKGAARRWRSVGIAAGVAAVGLAGMPPLALWAAKDEVLAVAREESFPLYVVGLAGAALAAAYSAKVLAVIWRQPPPDPEAGYDDDRPGTRRVVRSQRVPLIVLAVAAVLLAALALPPSAHLVRRALGETGTPSPDWTDWITSGVVAVAVLTAVLRWGTPRWRWARNWWGLQRAIDRGVSGPVQRWSGWLARFDDRVVDGGLMTVATAVRTAGQRSATIDDRLVDAAVRRAATVTLAAAELSAEVDVRRVDAAVESTARGFRRAGSLARRPQTGQVHQYYLMAVLTLVVAAGALVVFL